MLHVHLHVHLNERTGANLQRIMRQGSSQNHERAALLLQSGLGVSVDELERRYGLGRLQIEALIVRFNALGGRALQIKRPPAAGLRYAMNDTETAIVKEMIRLTPRAFGRPDNRWLADELCDELRRLQLVGYLDKKAIQDLLDADQTRR